MATGGYQGIGIISFCHLRTLLGMSLSNFSHLTSTLIGLLYCILHIIRRLPYECPLWSRWVIPGLTFNIVSRGSLSFVYVILTLCSGHDSRRTTTIIATILLLKVCDVVVSLTGFVVQFMLLSINDNHTVTYSFLHVLWFSPV